MIRRLLLAALVIVAALGASLPSSAQSGAVVDVVEVSGPIDARLSSFAAETIRSSNADVVVLQVDSPGVSSGEAEFLELLDLVADPPTPVAVYVGARPARAYGGAAMLLASAQLPGAAPGVAIGYLDPWVVGIPAPSIPSGLEDFADAELQLTAPVPGLVDELVPSIGQFIVGLDGATVTVDGADVVLDTADTVTNDDGTQTVVPAGEVRFVKASLWTRFLRLASTPEATFFFLMAGLAAAAFEFYAAGAGVTAAVAVVSLFIAGYGLATLPVRWWALGLAVVGLWLYTVDFQHNRLGWRSVAGTAALLTGGRLLVDASPQFAAKWPVVVLTVIGVALFYVFALSTVVRARFSTRTIGREHLVGKEGVVATPFDPEGVVTIDGARWRARSTRAAGISPGDTVVVIEVKGILLEVDPVRE